MTRALPEHAVQPRRRAAADVKAKRRLAGAAARRAHSDNAPAGVNTAEVRFALGRRALARHDAAVTPNGDAPLELVFTLSRDRDEWTVSADLCDAGVRRLVAPPAPMTWVRDDASGLWHAQGDTLEATLELTEAAARLLFARSPLMATLGLNGGRYETAGASIS